jgi:hypothetical protein
MTIDCWSGAFAVPSHVLLQELPGTGLIFLDLRTEEYFGLDDVGTRMYETVIRVGTAEAAVEALAPEYEVEAEVLRQDLTALLTQLVERGLLLHEPG